MIVKDIRTDLSFNGLNVLYQIAKTLSAGGELHSILDKVLQTLEKQAGMSSGMISILNSNQTELLEDIAYGIPGHFRQKGNYRLGEGIVGQVALTGKPIAIHKMQNDPKSIDQSILPNNIDLSDLALLCVPIKVGDLTVGVLSVDKVVVEESITLDGELRFLEAVSDLIAQTVNQARIQTEEIARLQEENLQLRYILENRGKPDDMIGNSGSMREVYRYIAQVAPSMTTVLIRGETGTGKELFALAIHQKSKVKDGPFIVVNCAAIPDTLFESELFGYEKGAFTNAFTTREGKFELANNGTLFLDEVGELSLSTQSRLLRAIQEREFQRIGGTNSIHVNVRLITATNRDLEKAVQDGTFREDLYYRLNVFTIALPPLQERGADVLLLANHFIKKYSKLHRKQIDRLSTPAIEMLSAYSWPGNVRELENVIERGVLVAEGHVIDGHDLPPSLQKSSMPSGEKIGTLENLIASYEKELIIDALKDSNGNQSDAADLLKTTKRIIQYKIEKYNIDYRKFRSGSARLSQSNLSK